MAKLKNIQAVTEMLKGEHKTQTRKTFGLTDVNAVVARNAKHEVGDVWVETHPITGVSYKWEQKDGYRVKVLLNLDENVQDIRNYLRTFQNCPKDVCTCINPSNLDKKFKGLVGKCHECVLTLETQLKIKGEFNEYALEKIKNNAKVFLKQTDDEVEQLKREISQPINFIEGADGRTETWTNENPQYLIDQIDNQYSEFKNKIAEKLGEI
jgi:ElaB/YqjD/DUF883 family membrane-anchored ribosome-binding protein